MKFRGHETFYIRKGWLTKGLKRVNEFPNIFSDKDKNQMDEFGIGSNMVKALRYWMIATGLTTEQFDKKIKVQLPTILGELVNRYDRYLEEIGTLYLVHYELAKNEDMATSWYHFFNGFNLTQFNKEDFVDDIKTYLSDQGEKVADRSLDDDFSCIINTYVSKSVISPGRIDPENLLDCPLGELKLISSVDSKKRIYKKNIVPVGSIPEFVFLAIIMDQKKDSDEIKIESLLKDKNNVGKVFNLDATTLMQYLEQLKNKGLIDLVRTAGLDIIKVNRDLTYENCIEDYYESLQIDGIRL
ncbi:MAG: DUF4007 family protein [Vallitaleaceae bacterium]|jgi:hypothetical protein|nr:DUF4007 family protein [Vallitaleaceae bacterium]